jgi:hypothetical protein
MIPGSIHCTENLYDGVCSVSLSFELKCSHAQLTFLPSTGSLDHCHAHMRATVQLQRDVALSGYVFHEASK